MFGLPGGHYRVVKATRFVTLSAAAVLVAAASIGAVSTGVSLASTGVAKSTVTLSRSQSPVLTGSAVIFTGQVTPKAQRKVSLQRRVGGKWKVLAAAKTSSHGAFRFRWVVTSPGTLTFRAGVKATSAAKGANSPAVTVVGERWHFLSDLADVDENCGCENGPIEINGKTYSHSVFDLGTTGTDDIEYNLKRGCFTLMTVAGLGDDSSSDASEEMDILLDGTNKFSKDFGLGQSASVKLKVNGNLRLRLSWTYLAGSDPDIGWGNARILCKW